jgi:hypothetical protein
MSQAAEVIKSAQEDAEQLLPLMREYRDTLEKYLEPLLRQEPTRTGFASWGNSLNDSPWGAYLKDKLATIMPLVEKVASNASGLLEHTELDFLTERELKLRLTEFEVIFRHYDKVIAQKSKAK